MNGRSASGLQAGGTGGLGREERKHSRLITHFAPKAENPGSPSTSVSWAQRPALLPRWVDVDPRWTCWWEAPVIASGLIWMSKWEHVPCSTPFVPLSHLGPCGWQRRELASDQTRGPQGKEEDISPARTAFLPEEEMGEEQEMCFCQHSQT